MASKKSTAAAKKDVASPPVLLTQGQRRRYALGMVFALVVFAIGSLGLLVLLVACMFQIKRRRSIGMHILSLQPIGEN
ncbi:hypothetical protein Ndes2437B_g07869 [Nannochloris sp. 'desiccata']